MPVASQELVLDRVVGWLEETLAGRDAEPASMSAAAPETVLA
jgi:hypothetical protein